MRRRLGIVVAAAAAALSLGAPPAGAWTRSCCLAWQQPAQVAISPDGRFAYASDYTVALALTRNPDTGELSILDSYDARGGGSTELSPDGRSLYVVSTQYPYPEIAAFSRDEASGALTAIGNYRSGNASHGSRPFRDMAFTSDSRTVYLTDGGAIEIAARDSKSGVLTYRQDLQPGASTAPDLTDPFAIEVSPDDQYVYVLQGGGRPLLTFARLADGSLSEIQATASDSSIVDIALSPDGTRLYAGPSGPVSYARDPATGMLTLIGQANVDIDQEGHVPDGEMLVTPDGSGLYALDFRAHHVYQYAKSDDGLRFVKTYRENADGQGLRYPRGVSISPDGAFVYIGSGAIPTQTQPARIAAFRRDRDTNGLSFASLFEGPLFTGIAPWETPPATVSINDGADYTNDPDVTLTITGISLPSSLYMQISNDGGFGPGASEYVQPTAEDHHYSWTLATSGPERLPKTVYVRTRPGGDATQLISDDIVLDQRPPEIAAVVQSGGSVVRIQARDRISGVQGMQVTRNRRKPAPWQPYRERTHFKIGRRPLYLRVRDAAGNRSRWKTVRGRR
jgi:6-phosphogluconolactonase (cycloisomerase 2 family)